MTTEDGFGYRDDCANFRVPQLSYFGITTEVTHDNEVKFTFPLEQVCCHGRLGTG